MYSDELKKLFWTPMLRLEKKISISLGLVKVIINGYQK